MGSVRHIAIKRKGLDLRLCDTAIHADRIRVPVLIFQGGEDEITRPSGSKRIFDNIRAPKRLVQIDRADHLMGYDISPSTYEREVRHFIEQCVVRLVSIGRM
jgi:alpha-beta hydrolase superfamily lysophospholipase